MQNCEQQFWRMYKICKKKQSFDIVAKKFALQ